MYIYIQYLCYDNQIISHQKMWNGLTLVVTDIHLYPPAQAKFPANNGCKRIELWWRIDATFLSLSKM